MKKLFLILMAALAVLSASAADLYLRGTVTSWNALNAYKFSTTDNDTYTLDVASLSGEFKVADAGWSTYNYGATNSKKVEIGTPYVCTSGGGNMSLSGTGSATNVRLTFVLSTRTLTITGQEAANDYDVIYVIGDFNGTSWSETRTDMPLSLVSGTEDTFEGTVKFTSTDNYLKFKAGTWVYGPGESATADVDLDTDGTTTITNPAGDKAYMIPAGEYKMTIKLTNGSSTGTLTVGSGAPVVLPVAIAGAFNNWSDTANVTTNIVDGLASVIVPAYTNGTGEGTGFKVVYGTTWYGLSTTLANGVMSETLAAGAQDDNIQLPADAEGKDVTFTFDTEAKTVKAVWSADQYPATLYMIGMDNFKYQGEAEKRNYIPMEKGENGVYTAKNIIVLNNKNGSSAPIMFGDNPVSADCTRQWGTASLGAEALPDRWTHLDESANGSTMYSLKTLYNLYNITVDLSTDSVYLETIPTYESVVITGYFNSYNKVENSTNIIVDSVATIKVNNYEKQAVGFTVKWHNVNYGIKNLTLENRVPSETLDVNPGSPYMLLNKEALGQELTFKFNVQTKVLTVSWGDEPDYPVALYMLGDAQGWDPSAPLLLTADGSGKYTLESVEMTKASGSDYSYFSFCTAKGSNSNDWAGVGTRYGASTDGYTLSDGVAATLVEGENAFMVPGALTYKVEVNFADMTVTATNISGIESVAADAEAPVDVYTAAGVRVRTAVNAADATTGLPAGFYIVGTRKVIVR